jgi:hypothetical protein
MEQMEQQKKPLVDLERLHKELDFLYRQIAILRGENFLLKRAIKAALGYASVAIPDTISLEVPEEPTESWSEKAKRFSAVDSAICKVVVKYVSEEGKPAHYDDIINRFKMAFPTLFRNITNPGDTISRRCRQLREEGYLASCSPGYFQPGPKLMKEKRSGSD